MKVVNCLNKDKITCNEYSNPVQCTHFKSPFTKEGRDEDDNNSSTNYTTSNMKDEFI